MMEHKENKRQENRGITLIVLIVTIVLNCSYLAMVGMRKMDLKKEEAS